MWNVSLLFGISLVADPRYDKSRHASRFLKSCWSIQGRKRLLCGSYIASSKFCAVCGPIEVVWQVFPIPSTQVLAGISVPHTNSEAKPRCQESANIRKLISCFDRYSCAQGSRRVLLWPPCNRCRLLSLDAFSRHRRRTACHRWLPTFAFDCASTCCICRALCLSARHQSRHACTLRWSVAGVQEAERVVISKRICSSSACDELRGRVQLVWQVLP